MDYGSSCSVEIFPPHSIGMQISTNTHIHPPPLLFYIKNLHLETVAVKRIKLIGFVGLKIAK